MTTSMDEVFRKFNVQLGETVNVGISSGRFCANEHEVWTSPDSYLPAYVVGAAGGALIVAFTSQDTQTLTRYGAHKGVMRGELAEPFHRLLEPARAQFRLIFSSNAFKRKNLPSSNEELGLKIGDRILVKGVWFESVEAQVVGFSDLGNPVIRTESAEHGLRIEDGYEEYVHATYKINHKPNHRYWFLAKDLKFKEWDFLPNNNSTINKTVNGKVNKGEVVMGNNSDRKFFDMVKSDATEAAYRVGAKQITKGSKAAVLALLEKQGGSSDGLKAFAEMMDTDIGEAILSSGLGLAITYMPIEAAQGEHVQKLAEEFRINGMSTAGNAVFETAMEYLLPVITGALASLPPVEAAAQARVASTSGSSEEYIEETHVPAKQARV